jgi:hypothetical protein
MADTAGVLDETYEWLHQADPEAGADELPSTSNAIFPICPGGWSRQVLTRWAGEAFLARWRCRPLRTRTRPDGVITREGRRNRRPVG